MSVIVFFKDTLENNGKSVCENNMKLKHNIPVGTLVEVQFSEWFGNGACIKSHARLYVVRHDRDCDGTPLYCLCKSNKPMSGVVIMDDIVLKGSISSAIINSFVTGILEEKLTPIEVTQEIMDGVGSLSWEDE